MTALHGRDAHCEHRRLHVDREPGLCTTILLVQPPLLANVQHLAPMIETILWRGPLPLFRHVE